MPRRKEPDPLAGQLGLRIRELREESQLTQESLAYLGDVAKGFLSDTERGLALPSLTTLEVLANVLGVKLLNLFVRPTSSDPHASSVCDSGYASHKASQAPQRLTWLGTPESPRGHGHTVRASL